MISKIRNSKQCNIKRTKIQLANIKPANIRLGNFRNRLTTKPIRSTLSIFMLSTLMCFGTALSTVHAKSNDQINTTFSSILEQERTWAGLKSQKKQVAEIEWHYSEGGDASKPTVLLIHGLSGTRDNWNRVVHYLTPYYHVIIPDLPFHGDTKVPKDFDSSVPNLTEKLKRFTEALGINDSIHIAGHSLGGAIAYLYSAQYSHRINSLLLMNAAGVYKTANTVYLKDPTQLKSLIVDQSGEFEQLLELTMANPPFIPKEILKEQEKLMIKNAAQTQHVIEQIVMIQKAFTPESFAMAGRIIDSPVLILWGDQDRIINKEVASELQSLLKNSQKPIIYKGVGHMPLLELDQVVAQDYLNFLNKAQLAKQKKSTQTTP